MISIDRTKEESHRVGNRYINMFRYAVKSHIETNLPRFSPDKIVVISFEDKVFDYDSGQYVCNKTIQLVAYRPNNYTAIFSREFDSVPHFQELPIYRNLLLWCYHDSCWGSDGVDRCLQFYQNRLTGFRYNGFTGSETLSALSQEEMRKTLREQSIHEGNMERCHIIDEMMKNA